MKKCVFALIFVCLLLLLVSCGQKSESTANNTSSNTSVAVPSSNKDHEDIVSNAISFTGEILSVENGSIMVAPDEENSAISPKVVVNTSQFPNKEFCVGDKVRVIYNGQVAQSFPPQIFGVTAIEIIE